MRVIVTAATVDFMHVYTAVNNSGLNNRIIQNEILFKNGRKVTMKNLYDIVQNYDIFHCICREGFIFTSISEPVNILDAIVIRNPLNCDCWTPKKSFSERSLEDHIKIINKYRLEKAIIIAENIDFITRCPSLKYLEIVPADTAPEKFDYSPLYKMPEIKYLSCRTEYGGYTIPFSTAIDYTNIHGLTELNIEGKGHKNYEMLRFLERLYVSNDKELFDLQNVSFGTDLKQLWFIQCKLKSLKGIKQFQNLQQLSLDYIQTLEDISEISGISSSLRSLCIENCSRIKDFSCLNQLSNLEYLELHGKNELADLEFLNMMPKLKNFFFHEDQK